MGVLLRAGRRVGPKPYQHKTDRQMGERSRVAKITTDLGGMMYVAS